MKQEERRFIFKTIRIWNVNEDASRLADTKKYSSISIISYQPLVLSKDFFVKHKKIVNIYLDDEIDNIFYKFNRATRREINKTHSMTDLNIIMEDDNFNEAYDLYKKFEYSQGRVPWRKETFKKVKLFNAYYKGEIVSVITCYDLFPYLQARSMSSARYIDDKEMQKIIGHITRRLIFDICKYAKQREYVFFGLGSINYENEQKSNVSQFKCFFGGKIEDEYEYIYKSKLFIIFAWLASIRAILKSFIYKLSIKK